MNVVFLSPQLGAGVSHGHPIAPYALCVSWVAPGRGHDPQGIHHKDFQHSDIPADLWRMGVIVGLSRRCVRAMRCIKDFIRTAGHFEHVSVDKHPAYECSL